MSDHCCEQFSKMADPERRYPRFVYEYGRWNINIFCASGLFVVESMRHCPYCGAELKAPTDKGTEPS